MARANAALFPVLLCPTPLFGVWGQRVPYVPGFEALGLGENREEGDQSKHYPL